MYITLLIYLHNAIASDLNIHPNSVEDPLEAQMACGEEGYILDAPIPELIKSRRTKRAATNQPFRVWPLGEIPYVIDKKLSSEASVNIIKKSMQHWMNETCVKFIERTQQPDYVKIVRGEGCCSYVGRRGGVQYLSLGFGCLRFGIVTHELGHAVGFWHEQNRPDRSIYIDVIYDNVDSSKYINFDLRGPNEINTFDQIYDYSSIMHYGKSFFTKDGSETIRVKNFRLDPSYKRVPGNPDTNAIGESYYKSEGPALSRFDILKTNLLYKCSRITECGGTLFASKGSFVSMNFPKPYAKNTKQDCLWVVSTTRNKKYKNFYTSLTLSFDSFNVGTSEYNHNCQDDYVEVREGKGHLSPYIVRYCGDRKPAPIITMSGSLYVRFHISGNLGNDALAQMNGFQAKFKTDACSHRVTHFPTTIQSPQFPFGYQQGKDCLWVIETKNGMIIEINFKFFMLRENDDQEGCLDYLEIHEGDGETERYIGRFCGGNNPGVIKSKLNRVKLHFHSAEVRKYGWYMGFQADVIEKDINECESEDHGCSQACLNYPGGYFCGCYTGYDTVYQLPSRKAECIDKNECKINNGGCSDICVNFEGGFQCECPRGYVLNGKNNSCIDVNECLFQNKPCSHHCTNHVGSYECSCEPGYILKSDNKTCVELPSCKGKFNSPIGHITSPSIPVVYKKPVTCIWRIAVPRHLQLVLNFDVPWESNSDCNSYIAVYENSKRELYNSTTSKICLQSDVNDEVVMKKHSAVVKFHAKVPFPQKFRIEYNSRLPKIPSCKKDFNITNGRVITPGYPFKYPDSTKCEWNIFSPNHKKVRVKFGHFDIEYHDACSYDFITLKQYYLNSNSVKEIGRFCGDKKPPPIYFDGKLSYMKIIFHSDETMSKKGVKILFKEVDVLQI